MQLGYLLETRAEYDELVRGGVAKKTIVAASLHPKSSSVDRHLRRRSVEMHLQTRPSFDEVAEAYIPSSAGESDYSTDDEEEEIDYGRQGGEDYGGRYDDEEEESDGGEDLYYEKDVEEDYEDDYGSDEIMMTGGLGRWTATSSSEDDDDDSSEEDNSSDNFVPADLDERMLFAIALRAAAQLEQGGFIGHIAKAKLKERYVGERASGSNTRRGKPFELARLCR